MFRFLNAFLFLFSSELLFEFYINGDISTLRTIKYIILVFVLMYFIIFGYLREGYSILSRRGNSFVLFFVFSTLYVTINFFLSDGLDSELIVKSLRAVPDLMFGIGFFGYLMKRNLLYSYSNFILIFLFIQGLVMVGEYFSIDLKIFFDNLFLRDVNEGTKLRSAGFTLAGGDVLSIKIVLLLFLSFSLNSNIYKGKNKYILVFVVLSTMFAARSGLLLALIWATYHVFFERKINFRLVFQYSLMTLTLILLLSQIYKVVDSSNFNDPLTRFYEAYINYAESGNVRTSSSDVLLNKMVFLPDDEGRLLFGNGHYGRMSFDYVRSDIGYIRDIFGLGLIGVIFYWLPFLSVITKRHLFFGVFLLAVAHFKIPFLYSEFGIIYLVILILNKNSFEKRFTINYSNA